MIDKHFQTLLGGGYLEEADIRQICFLVTEKLVNEPTLLRLASPIYVCGDIHGQFFDLLQLMALCGGIEGGKFLFLGDYVDRGYYSLETIMLLFLYKIKYPDRIYLLRGNHQCKSLSRIYGFYEEVQRKYGCHNAWRYITDTFLYLPLAGIVQQSIFCVHGGISPELEWVDQIDDIDRQRQISQSGLMADILWSDPQNIQQDWKVNPRGAGFIFSNSATTKFNMTNDITLVCRSHQLVDKGYNYNFQDQSIVTVWSAPNYYYRCNNKAAVLHLGQNLQRKFVQFEAAQQNSQNIMTQYILPYFL